MWGELAMGVATDCFPRIAVVTFICLNFFIEGGKDNKILNENDCAIQDFSSIFSDFIVMFNGWKYCEQIIVQCATGMQYMTLACYCPDQ